MKKQVRAECRSIRSAMCDAVLDLSLRAGNLAAINVAQGKTKKDPIAQLQQALRQIQVRKQ